ncbi:pyridoxamine 5'-phosphate oxidase family protein, partial [uncultured Duncaniella sp.]
KAILNTATNGILSLTGPDGTPYGVPLSFVYDGDNAIYFHSARNGYKMECIEADSRCSFCVVGQDMIVADEFTSYFRSVIAEGRINVVTEESETRKGLDLLCEKYSPGVDSTDEIKKCLNHVAVLRLDIIRMTGKEAIELVRMREKK